MMKIKTRLLIIILSVGSLTLSAGNPSTLKPVMEPYVCAATGDNALPGNNLTMVLIIGAAYGLARLYKPSPEAEEE